MKKLILLLLISNLSFAQQWSKTEINNLLTVDFPNTPKEKKGVNKTHYYSSYEENTYEITVRDSNQFNLPESPSKSELTELYKTYSNGYINGLKGTIIKQKKILINDLIGNETIFIRVTHDKTKILTFRRTFLLKDKLVSYQFSTNKKNEKEEHIEKLKNIFLNSLNINS